MLSASSFHCRLTLVFLVLDLAVVGGLSTMSFITTRIGSVSRRSCDSAPQLERAQLFRLVQWPLFEQHVGELVAGDLEPLNRLLVAADDRLHDDLQRGSTPPVVNCSSWPNSSCAGRKLVLDSTRQISARSVAMIEIGTADSCARSRSRTAAFGDHQAGLSDRLEFGPSVLGQQILDRQLVKIKARATSFSSGP